MPDEFDEFFNGDEPSEEANSFIDGSIELTFAQQKKILETWNSGEIGLKSLIQAAWGPQYDGRSKQGMLVKLYLASKNLKSRTANEYAKKTDALKLTEMQRATIVANANSMKPLEITRLIFKDNTLTNLSSEFRVVNEYYISLDQKVRLTQDNDNLTEDEYRPPKTEGQALYRVNKYVLNAIDGEKITNTQKENLQKLIRFMHTHRYLFEMNNLRKIKERELYESSLVRFIHDKPDLTEEEIDQYLNLCSDIINYYRMQVELQAMSQARDDSIEDSGKISSTLIEEIGNLRSQMGENLNRQKRTLNDLNGKRSERLKTRVQENASILNLVEAWKDYDTRQKLIHLAELRKKDIGDEIERLSSMDAVHFELFGLTKEEGMNS